MRSAKVRTLPVLIGTILVFILLIISSCDSTAPTTTVTVPGPTVTVSAPAETVTAPNPTVTVTITPPPPPEPVPTPASISVSPIEATNPVKTQHTFTAKVSGADGSPSVGAEVSWILNRFPDAVGDIVEVSNQTKLDNRYAVSLTGDDGTATMTITSTQPGDTDVTVFCPDIADSDKHKVFAVKHWVDMMVGWPVDATNKIGSNHIFSVNVYKATDKTPLAGINVRWTIIDDTPNAMFSASGAATNTATTATNAAGMASVTLQQVDNTPGDNTIRMEVLSAGGLVMFSQEVTKTWLSPTLNILKSASVASAEIGETVEYAITVRNDGEESATSVVVTDDIPAGLTYVSSTPAGTVSGTTITWNVGNLAKDASTQLTARFTAKTVGDWTNTARTTCAEGLAAQASAAVSVTGSAALQITKTGPTATLTEGDPASYTITVRSTGNIAAENTVVTDTIPAGLTYVSSAPAAASVSGGSVTWNLGNLNPGAVQTLTVNFTTTNSGTITNNARATAGNAAEVAASFTINVIPPKVSDITITKTGSSSIYLGKNGQFTMIVTNNGETALTNVKVTDTLPANLSYVSSSPAGTASGKTVTWTFATMAVGESKTVIIECNSTAVGNYVNTVSVTADEGVTATATSSGVVTAEAGVTMQMTDTIDPVSVGSQTTYIVTVTNQGLIAVHDLVISFSLPAEVGYVSATGPTSPTVSGQVVTFAPVSTLNADGTITFSVVVTANTAGNVVCTVTRSYAEFTTPVNIQEGTTIYVP